MHINELVQLVKDKTPQLHLHSGKVRESFRAQDPGKKYPTRLVVSMNRRSIFDMMLGQEIEGIGILLNVANVYFKRQLTAAEIPNDLVAWGPDIVPYLQEFPEEFRNDPELWKCAVIVREMNMHSVECVARNILTGGGYKLYKKEQGNVCGNYLPLGLYDGFKLPYPISTPTTKAKEGHDLPLDVMEVEAQFPGLLHKTLRLLEFVTTLIERSGKFTAVDLKAECGVCPITGEFMWGDELGTPDSSRIWKKYEFETMLPKRLPPAFDKEVLRDWGRLVGIDRLDPLSEADIALAKTFRIPDSVTRVYMSRCREYIFDVLGGYTWREFLVEEMSIPKQFA